jgi:hypothetical protein
MRAARAPPSLEASTPKSGIQRERDTAHMSIVQSGPETARGGGIIGKGFTPGVSGNPGRRPRGAGRRVRGLVGEDGAAIADSLLSVMNNERARTADRIEAAKWLADRGFGRAALVIDAGPTPEEMLRDYFEKLSFEDLETMQAILEKYSPVADERTDSGEIRRGVQRRAITAG